MSDRAINAAEVQARFLISQIKTDKTTYSECIAKRPDLKEEIDKQLEAQGLEHLKEQ